MSALRFPDDVNWVELRIRPNHHQATSASDSGGDSAMIAISFPFAAATSGLSLFLLDACRRAFLPNSSSVTQPTTALSSSSLEMVDHKITTSSDGKRSLTIQAVATEPTAFVVSRIGLHLCGEYLAHFSSNSAVVNGADTAPTFSSTYAASVVVPQPAPAVPSSIPAPLTAPLETFLSPWEQQFITTRLLGSDGDAWDHATLIATMHTASLLRMKSLESLCQAWCGARVNDICQQTTNALEAAEMIRKFFDIPSDWTDAETECLKIENEWPAGEA